MFITFSWLLYILGSLGSNLVFIIPFGIMLFLTEYMNDFGIIKIKFGNEFCLGLFQEYISPKLFAVWGSDV